jgi:hypothetical protein
VPELAEVEYFRRRWDNGIGQRVVRVVYVESRSGAVKFRRSLSGDQHFRLLVPE